MTAVHIMEQVFVITFKWLTWYNGMLKPCTSCNNNQAWSL